ncbi:putative amino acid racemase [Thermosporothrix hazakensis]|jgi:predicted amino acid racemase|uniref:Uncharacterized protein n=2 Tax=Thermosporothrix TaxID=768650 RepID=A0A455SVF3_9CHLR|nr:alanine racemase [Thermosporothrix hazakensis]PZW22953.1 putative amino acid racemase [Thermosporothrix hazakensis]BBH90045.1 hypothetical protein KTC_47960 [Thermosporothrix sp. COM3]GCE48266.1 hypothetical protein KTH_31350 [Thermosporothrix hazakensis]
MFLDAVRKRNPGLIRFAAQLHREGMIPPNTFVIDKGAVRKNAHMIASRAHELGLKLYFMAKQFSYDAEIMEAIRESIPSAVAVDWMGAEAMMAQQVPVKHVGHLVPIPFHTIPKVMQQARPEVWTVLDLEAAAEVSRIASALNITQPVLLRITGDDLFPGQEGGFTSKNVQEAAKRIADMPGLEVAGVTSYPCFAWDEQSLSYKPTSNLEHVQIAIERLKAEGFTLKQINLPGNTSRSVLSLVAQYGGTHGEPGHALTGTTPEQSQGHCDEIPATVYVSEISSIAPDQAQVYGGGLYPRAHARGALVGSSVDELVEREPLPIEFPPAQYIDYQCTLKLPEGQRVHCGDTVVMSFRFQLFVLRSYRAIVEQDEHGTWKLLSFH